MAVQTNIYEEDVDVYEPEPPEHDFYESVVKDVAKLITEDPDIIV